ncbi:uncharacterized protein BJ171DRAFT_484204 [Polychytrium aggregatum]|uniref:uncharacterized protein n=1 Tax=Polychytrium aggregatum TaxID=110093 RepID=UPI0022FE1CBB|nr:uncharacterized protein BJ171DRAFT_484204 [Polychytrium aggregatum]KAI9209520.1 hypothetical protein BJ171DRAFT_484204 [Polychytrium aggregatum]
MSVFSWFGAAPKASQVDPRLEQLLSIHTYPNDFKYDIGLNALPLLIHLLQSDRSDPELLVDLIAALSRLCVLDQIKIVKTNDQAEDLGLTFTNLVLESPDNVKALISVLEESNPSLRASALKLLLLLQNNNIARLRLCLDHDATIFHLLMSLLDTDDTATKAGILEFLISVTKDYPAGLDALAELNYERLVPKVAADPLSRLSQLLLELTLQILRAHPENQDYFMDSETLINIEAIFSSSLFKFSAPFSPEPDESQQIAVTNAILVMEILREFLNPHSHSNVRYQNLFSKGTIVIKVVELALAPLDVIPLPLKITALCTMGDLMRGSSSNQKYLTFDEANSSKGFIQLVEYATGTHTLINLRIVACYAFESFLIHNNEMKAAIVKLIQIPSGRAFSGLAALVDLPLAAEPVDPTRFWFAANFLSIIIQHNREAKKWMTSAHGDTTILQLWMNALIRNFQNRADPRIQSSLLVLLITALIEVKDPAPFVAGSLAVDHLADMASAGETMTQGLAAFFLGLCLSYCTDEAPELRKSIHNGIHTTLGIEIFKSRLQNLCELPTFRELQNRDHSLLVSVEKTSTGIPCLLVDHNIVELVQSMKDHVVRCANPVDETDSSQLADLQRLRVQLEEKDEYIEELKLQIRQLEEKVDSLQAKAQQQAEAEAAAQTDRPSPAALSLDDGAAADTAVADSVEPVKPKSSAEQQNDPSQSDSTARPQAEVLETAANNEAAESQDTAPPRDASIKQVPKDPKDAQLFYRTAISNQINTGLVNPHYCYELAVLLQQSKDYAGALRYYKMASHRGHIRAKKSLGDLYFHGLGVEANAQTAFEHYLRAAELGDLDSQNYVGFCYYKGIGVKADDELSIHWYQKAAQAGHTNAQSSLSLPMKCRGDLFFHGSETIPKDVFEAVRWYRRSADLKNPMAQNMLGYCYEEGIGIEKDGRKAFELYERSAKEGGWAPAQFNVGMCYEKGVGTERDLALAEIWYQKAAGQNHKQAQEALEALLKNKQLL